MATDINQSDTHWQAALTTMQTSLPDDLFQLVKKSLKISHFVKESCTALPEEVCQFLKWHSAYADEVIQQDLPLLFNQFCDSQTLHHHQDITEAQMMMMLRHFRRAHSAAIAILELSNQLPIQSTSFRISLLADILIKVAYEWSYEDHKKRWGFPADTQEQPLDLLIVAMGKLGGLELNFSSDIDLIFFYPKDGETKKGARKVENAKFFRRLSTQLIQLLDKVTEDGFVFRVDMRLRPYGDSGALVMSLAQAEDYYQEQGREWERFAMLRARILTGNLQAQKQLNDIIRTFSFRRYIDYGVIESIRNMKEMIQREVRRKGLQENIKLGAGGIREVEFIVQSLQLIQGGRDKRLQEKNTFKVLPLLVESNLLPEKTAKNLKEAYVFLRRLEHCIQELAEKQTQQLPDNITEQNSLCVALNFSDWSQLLAVLTGYQQSVNQHFNELLGEQRTQALTQDDFYQSLSEGHIDAFQLQNKLKEKQSHALSETVCQSFISLINQFLNESAVVKLSARGAKRLKTFFPELLATCLATEQPDLTLSRLLKILQAILKRTAYLELLSENPPILQHLVDLAGQSEWIVKRLSDYPILFDELLYPNSLYEPLQTADLRAELQQTLLRVDDNDEEELLDSLRTFKQINELRIAAALLAERLNISQVSRYLTQLAEVVLQTSVSLCWSLVTKKHGVPESLNHIELTTHNENSGKQLSNDRNYGFAVIGYGKLGGFELGFDSDLDLVFLFNQSVDERTNGKRSLSNSRFYTRLAQKLIHFLSTRTNLGLLYEVDMRLRPSGSSGLLVSHIEAYRDYQLDSAWVWEHQALVRARLVVGDQSLNGEFKKIRNQVLQMAREPTHLKNNVIEMRTKMRQQLEKKAQGKIDLKQAVGGLVDIEFLAQFFSLQVNHELLEPHISIPHNMVDCLKMAHAENQLTQQEATTLIKTYRLLRNKLNEMTLIQPEEMANFDQFVKELASVEVIWKKILLN